MNLTVFHSVNGRSFFILSSCNGRITRSIPWYRLQIGRDCRRSRAIEEYRPLIEVGNIELEMMIRLWKRFVDHNWALVETYVRPHFNSDVGKKQTKRARSFLSFFIEPWISSSFLFISLHFFTPESRMIARHFRHSTGADPTLFLQFSFPFLHPLYSIVSHSLIESILSHDRLGLPLSYFHWGRFLHEYVIWFISFPSSDHLQFLEKNKENKELLKVQVHFDS